jgi:hypothetical protein
MSLLVRHAYDSGTSAVCPDHYDGRKPLPDDAPRLGPVQAANYWDSCDFCRQQRARRGKKATQRKVR